MFDLSIQIKGFNHTDRDKMNSTSQIEVKDDRRKYPRLVLQIPVNVHIEYGKYADACLYDLSPDGLQIRCDQETANQIDTLSKKNLYKDKPSITVEFALPQTNNRAVIVVKCSICYFSPLPAKANDDVALGLQFRQFSGDSLQQIKDFFLSELEPV